MKTILYTIILMFFVTFTVAAQTTTKNYVKTTTYQVGSSTGSVANNEKVETISYYDGLGRPEQSRVKHGGGSSLSHNVIDWKNNWVLGTGTIPFFNNNGSPEENNRILGVNPHGDSAMLWECVNDSGNNGDGGWNTDYISVDNTKSYRYTVWVKRTGSNNGTTYHGTQNVNNLDGTANSNPYFWTGDLPQLNQWYLLVGVIHSSGYTGNYSGVSGVYDINGNKVISGTEFKWANTTTTSRFRSYLYYATDTSVRQYFYNPIVQILDGNESSILDIIDEKYGNDIVTPVVYDRFGRQPKQYLPYADSGTSNLNYTATSGLLTTIENYYKNNFPDDIDAINPNPFSESVYDDSPLNRVKQQGAPGEDWAIGNGHEIQFEYGTNTNEVKLFDVSLSFADDTYTPTLSLNGTYAANTLTKTITKNENWTSGNNNTIHEYKNKAGQVVLKRNYANVGGVPTPHDTYYVYDDYGNLTYVLPPKMNASTVAISTINSQLNDLGYQYKYDSRNRLVEKKIPGKGWENIVYNKLDQPIMTQDANLNAQNMWLFTKYDQFGRVAYTGEMSLNISRTSLQSTVDGVSSNYVTRVDPSITIDATTIYYTNTAYPTANITDIHTINYYDSYVDLPSGLGSTATTYYGLSSSTDTKSLPTVSKTRVLGTSNWITAVNYYDAKGQPIYVYSKNDYLSTTDIVESKYNFTGQPTEIKTRHTKAGVTITTLEKFYYDHGGRLIKQTHKINSNPEEVIVENHYDALGQLIYKEVGNTSANPLQTVDYKYNIRGWLKQINNPVNLGNDLFGFKINYNTHDHGGTKLYNGNIAETVWKTGNTDNSLKWYKYSYDALNRISSATDNTNRYNLSNITYDKNGNILSLTRKGHIVDNPISTNSSHFGTMDILTYHYDGGSNRLRKVIDAAAVDKYGFKDDAVNTASDSTNDYYYDDNGNMLSDTNKGVGVSSHISYNHLNLPTNVPVGSENISYIYDATGVKLKKVVSTGVTTEYAGNYVYENGSLKFFNHPEGYIDASGSAYEYVYQYKDHLGNVRLSYKDPNGNYQQIIDSDFESDMDGWIHNINTTSNFENGRLKVNVDGSWEGIRHETPTLTVAPGEVYTAKIVFDKGNTQSIVRFYVQEFDSNGNHLGYTGLNYNIATGTGSYSYTVGSNVSKIHLRLDKDNTNTGTQTYFYVDHISFTRGALEIQEENNYYPFGLKHKGYNGNVNSTNLALKRKFGGKEYQDELGLGWYDITARNYDPALGRWMNLDPLAEEMRRHSPYNYAFDNPIFFQDPDGMKPCPTGDCDDDIIKKGKEAGTKIINSFMNFVSSLTGFDDNPMPSNKNSNTQKDEEDGQNKKVDAVVDLVDTVKENAAPAAKGLTYMAATEVKETAETVSDVANATTVATGGASLPITGPVAKLADGVASTATTVQGTIHAMEGNIDEAASLGKEALVSALTTSAVKKTMKQTKKYSKLTKKQEAVQSKGLTLFMNVMTSIFLTPHF